MNLFIVGTLLILVKLYNEHTERCDIIENISWEDYLEDIGFNPEIYR